MSKFIEVKGKIKIAVSKAIENNNNILDNNLIKEIQLELYPIYKSLKAYINIKRIRNRGSRVLREEYKRLGRKPKGMHISAIRDEFIEEYEDNDEVNW